MYICTVTCFDGVCQVSRKKISGFACVSRSDATRVRMPRASAKRKRPTIQWILLRFPGSHGVSPHGTGGSPRVVRTSLMVRTPSFKWACSSWSTLS